MSDAPRSAALLEALAWDSAHFGRKVAKLTPRRLDSDALALSLAEARRDGVWLVYWLAEAGQVVEARLLHEFGGERVSGHVRYARTLSPATPEVALHPELELCVDTGRPEDDAAIVNLGIAAGALSRFRQDRRLAAAKCDELYELWIRRSRTRELADEVLVARRDGTPVGLTTFRVRDGVADVGLVSTAAEQRGLGVASALLAFSHARIAARGVQRVEVVTQAENAAACRLYERQGYAPTERGEYYHFMPAD